MGDVFITRRGAASAGSIFAAVGVKYPAGSVCTCSKDGRVFTAGDKDGLAVFALPGEGVWTVSADDKAAKEVSITADARCQNVELAFEKVYFDGGKACDYSGGWNEKLTVGETIRLEIAASVSSTYDVYLYGLSEQSIDLADISELVIDVPTCSGCQSAYFFLHSTAGGDMGIYADPSPGNKWDLAPGENVIDVRNFSADFHFGFCISNAKGSESDSLLEIARISGE